MKKILFIGAGASRGARENMVQRPPLGLELHNWLFEVAEQLLNKLHQCRSIILEALEIMNKHKAEKDFEVLISKLGKDERRILQEMLQIAFSDLSKYGHDFGFTNVEDGYDKLIKKLNINQDEWIIISLNYDLLFEDALRRQSKEFIYPFFPYSFNDTHKGKKDLKLYKPHGSINFFAHADIQTTYGDDHSDDVELIKTDFEFEGGEARPNFGIVYGALPGTENVISRIRGIPNPVMANYTNNKGVDINPRSIKNVRNEACEMCMGENELVVIGIKPIFDKNDDPFVSEIFNRKYSQITYVGKGNGDCSLMRERFEGIKIYDNGLLPYLEKI